MGIAATSIGPGLRDPGREGDCGSPHPSGDTPGQVLFSRVGLRIPAALTYESWARAGIQIARIADSSAWCLGDWLICGQNHYRDRYQHAIDAAGLDYQTLRNYAWVARRFVLPRRREQLSFQHHAEVAALLDHEQDRLLDEAERQRWSRNQLRQNIRESRGATRNSRAVREAALPKVTAPRGQVQWWRSAAEQDGVDFEKWILVALDNAAQTILGAGPGAAMYAGPEGQAA